MGIVSAEGLYTGHPDFDDICVGYEVELCCDGCGKEFEQEELYMVGSDMFCEDCMMVRGLYDGKFEEYDKEESPAYNEDNEVIDYCEYCGAEDETLYDCEDDDGRCICCLGCACDNKYEKVSDSDIEYLLEDFLSYEPEYESDYE